MKGDTIMNTTNQTEQELMNYISAHKILNTHSHHLPEQTMIDFNLNKLIGSSYLQWQQVTPGTTAESRSVFLEKMRYRSFCMASKSNSGAVWDLRSDYTAELGSDFRSDPQSSPGSFLMPIAGS